MNDLEPTDPTDDSDDSTPLAELSEQITQHLQAGECIPVDGLIHQSLTDPGAIQELLPTLQELTELGRCLAIRRTDRANHPR